MSQYLRHAPHRDTLRALAQHIAGHHEGADGRVAGIEGRLASGRQVERYLLPGFIDLHVHGGGGVDIMEGGNAAEAQAFLVRFDAIFDVLKPSAAQGGLAEDQIEALIAERQAAKKSKNFGRADEIRKSLAEQGIVLEDTKDGVRWKRA